MAPSGLFQNGEVYNCVDYGIDSSVVGNTYRDISSFGNVLDWNVGAINPTWQNCADSDGSLTKGTNNINNIVPSVEYSSLSDVNIRFLKIRRTSQLLGTGRAVVNNLYDIAGLDRPGPAGNCIGSHELSTGEISDEEDIRAEPSLGLGPLGVQFTNIPAELE